MIKAPVGLNGIDPSDPSIIQPPDLSVANWILPTAADAASPDSSPPGPDLINSGSLDNGPIDLAEQAAAIRGPGNAQTIGAEASHGSDATASSAAQLSGPVEGDLAAASADNTPSGPGSSEVGPSCKRDYHRHGERGRQRPGLQQHLRIERHSGLRE